jgi:hypothetical protein
MKRGRPSSGCGANLGTLAAALHLKTDDLLKQSPDLAPWRPRVAIAPRLADAELVTLAVRQALPGYTPESRWLPAMFMVRMRGEASTPCARHASTPLMARALG